MDWMDVSKSVADYDDKECAQLEIFVESQCVPFGKGLLEATCEFCVLKLEEFLFDVYALSIFPVFFKFHYPFPATCRGSGADFFECRAAWGPTMAGTAGESEISALVTNYGGSLFSRIALEGILKGRFSVVFGPPRPSDVRSRKRSVWICESFSQIS